MTDDETLALFKSSGALKTGHFVLTSGRHSNQYFEKFDVMAEPANVEQLARELVSRARALGIAPDVVLGPTTLGIVLAYEVARQFGVRVAYGEKGPNNSRFLRRNDHMGQGMKVFVVDDVLTTGGSVRECLALVDTLDATCVGVGVLVDRSGATVDFGVPLCSTLTLNVESYLPDQLPSWLAEIPIHTPGSTGKNHQ